MLQSMRDDFPASMEGDILDGRVRDGKPESARFPGLVTLVILLFVGIVGLGLVMKWLVYGFP